MKRYLRIEKFRNIGIEKEETLMLNTSLKNGEQGNLIILIGENNSGKSNVLDALKCFKNKTIEERDRTNLSFKEEYRKPVLSLITHDGNKEFACSLEYGSSSYIASSNSVDYSKILPVKDALNIFDSLSRYKAYPEELKDVFSNEKAPKQEINEAIKRFLKLLRKDYSEGRSNYYHHNRDIYSLIDQNYPSLAKTLISDDSFVFDAQYEKCYGISFVPNVVVYKEKCIRNSDLSCNPCSINVFLSSVLDDIGFEKEEVATAYNIFNDQHYSGVLKKLEDKLNEKVDSISKKFNSIYKLDDGCYKFSFRAESESISLSVYNNSEPLNLDYQSTGFRWFFNLYFNLLSRNTMRPGDIIIMDEPATNLHVQGQQELRKFLKDFTIKTGVTIVMATHSPFLVDMDNLDELRIIKNINGITTIQNDFAAIAADDSDTLSSVIKSLTVKPHIMSDPDKHMVFVEGITDYNTLTKAVKLLGGEYQNLSFLPVNGIGKDKKHQEDVLRKVLEIGRKRNPILLVDGDKPGEAIKKLNGDNKDLLVISLTEIDPEYKELEELFSEEDRIKFGIQKNTGEYIKSSNLSSNIKNYRKDEDFSEKTKSNFKKVLDYIIEQSM